MRPTVIRNEHDYMVALRRVEKLMDAKPGSRQAEELDLLAALIEMYEESRFPIDLPDPVDAIRFRMDQQGL